VTPAAFDESCVLIEGDWTHRFVSANGSRFHVVEAGEGPVVLMLHGFPEFWGAWRHQLNVLAAAGFRAVAIDLRGYGASDKPPRGYDAYSMAADVTGLIRALGARDAVIVGAGYGGMLAWTVAALHRDLVRRLVILSAAHPLRLRTAAFGPGAVRGQRSAASPIFKFQLPRYEHVLTRDDAERVGGFIRDWSGPAWRSTEDFAAYERECRSAMQIPQAAFCSLEAFRWGVRSLFRLSGYRFRRDMRAKVTVDTLQLHGALDPVTLPSTAQGSGLYVSARYEWRLIDNVGHFPHLEAPDLVAGEILRWAKET